MVIHFIQWLAKGCRKMLIFGVIFFFHCLLSCDIKNLTCVLNSIKVYLTCQNQNMFDKSVYTMTTCVRLNIQMIENVLFKCSFVR